MYRISATNDASVNDMNEVLKSFKKMRMNKKTKLPTTHKNSSTSSGASTSDAAVVANKIAPTTPIDQQTKDLKKILKLFKKHVKKQIIFKKTKFVI